MPGSSSTNAPKSAIRVTLPVTRAPAFTRLANSSNGLVVSCLHAQADLAGLAVDAVHHHLDLLPDLDELGQVVDPLPGELGDGNEPVRPAEIDERAERLDALDDPLADLPLGDRRPELLGLLLPARAPAPPGG